MKMRWKLKPTKTEQTDMQGLEIKFLIDPKPNSLSVAHTIQHMLALRRKIITERKDLKLFLDAQTEKKINLVHSLKIGGAPAYTNSTAEGA